MTATMIHDALVEKIKTLPEESAVVALDFVSYLQERKPAICFKPMPEPLHGDFPVDVDDVEYKNMKIKAIFDNLPEISLDIERNKESEALDAETKRMLIRSLRGTLPGIGAGFEREEEDRI